MDQKSSRSRLIEKISTFIVDKRLLVFLVFISAIIFCIFSIPKTSLNSDIISYLPEDSETLLGFRLMDKEFTTYGSARIMISNISYIQAEDICEEISGIEGVSSVDFDNSDQHYKSASALFDVTFDGKATDQISLTALSGIKSLLSGYDVYISSTVGSSYSEGLKKEMAFILVLSLILILGVLLFTSTTYMEIPVLLIVFAVAAILNMGTNYLFGTISFITSNIAIVLQLALAFDYAVNLCHRYTEERKVKEAREAAIAALSKGAIEISSSSLTAIVSLVALTLMQFRLGYDMGLVMIKAILCSLVSVLFLMPGLLVLFHKGIDKTRHRNFVPPIYFIGRMANKTKYIVPPAFVLILVLSFFLSRQCDFAFGTKDIPTVKQNPTQIAEKKINETFKQVNVLAVVVPAGDYDKEETLLKELSELEHVESVTGLGNVRVKDYLLTEKMTPRMFAELTDLDIDMAKLLYVAYDLQNKQYGYLINDFNERGVPLYEMFMFAYQKVQEGYVTLDDDTNATLNKMYKQLEMATNQLRGDHYSRLVVALDLPEDRAETFAYLPAVREVVAKYYKENTYLVGNSVNNDAFSHSFENDDIKIAVLTFLFIMIVLLFTFRSAALPLLMVITIQGSVWINFAIQALSHNRVHFISYLIVSAIQMGATINYAIFITNRYLVAKRRMPKPDAIVAATNGAFPTIITSGTILAAAGILIGVFSSDPVISAIGRCLGRGAIISLLLILFVLPQILMLGDIIIEKTRFSFITNTKRTLRSGNIRVDGYIKGYVSGMINARISGTLRGEFNAEYDSRNTFVEYLDEGEETDIAVGKENEAYET